MGELFLEALTAVSWWAYLLRIGIFIGLAWVVHKLSNRLARRVVQFNRFHKNPKRRMRPERQKTMQSLISSLITFLAIITAVLFIMSQFVDSDTLIWMVGLFSAAFGLGARPLISDYLTGIGFLFEDTVDVGEKVEILSVEGVVEAVNLRTMSVRAATGELFVIPNGEVRVIRNFSRGLFSPANVKIKVASTDLNEALALLEELGHEATLVLPNLLEPWLVINESGTIGLQTELTLVTKARFGMAAEMKPRLLALVQEKLAEAEIALVD